MTEVVLDASTTLAWCFPDKTSDNADRLLLSLERKTILVPAVWVLEIANAVLVGERRKRLSQTDILRFITVLEDLSLVEDRQSVSEHLRNVLPLARRHNLSAYDAAYLELAIRHGAPIATIDAKLQKAAQKAGVTLLTG
ncbi:MAG TPA: type II toxin-antitoxin system VapC family toxin [Bryobacteraceae bacterium]|nr:type II toxin-antitoxin system VapC family toxin [Bryobacteraceae bacterium]